MGHHDLGYRREISSEGVKIYCGDDLIFEGELTAEDEKELNILNDAGEVVAQSSFVIKPYYGELRDDEVTVLEDETTRSVEFEEEEEFVPVTGVAAAAADLSSVVDLSALRAEAGAGAVVESDDEELSPSKYATESSVSGVGDPFSSVTSFTGPVNTRGVVFGLVRRGRKSTQARLDRVVEMRKGVVVQDGETPDNIDYAPGQLVKADENRSADSPGGTVFTNVMAEGADRVIVGAGHTTGRGRAYIDRDNSGRDSDERGFAAGSAFQLLRSIERGGARK